MNMFAGMSVGNTTTTPVAFPTMATTTPTATSSSLFDMFNGMNVSSKAGTTTPNSTQGTLYIL